MSHPFVPPPTAPTPEQQAVLERIAAQRERLRARRVARDQAAAQAAADTGVPADMPWLAKAVLFAREHPGLTASATAAMAMAVGPRRLVRWAGVLLPLLLRNRR